jgi:two-component system, response regulator
LSNLRLVILECSLVTRVFLRHTNLSEANGSRMYDMTDRTILLVEDNPDDETLILRALKKNRIGNEVIVVRDGAEALNYLFGTGRYHDRDLANMPELILLDLRLPKVDGIEVLREIRANERTRSLPVAVLTSSNADRDMVNSYAYGANAYVRKPVDMREFMEAIRELGLYLVILREAP